MDNSVNFRRQAVMNDILLRLQDADGEAALRVILDRVGACLDASRVLLFRDSGDYGTCRMMYEWLNRGATPAGKHNREIAYSVDMPDVYVALRKTGMALFDAGAIPEHRKEEFERDGVVASAAFAVHLFGRFCGFIRIDDCVVRRTWDADTVDFLKNSASLVSTVLQRRHADEQLRRNEERIREIAFTDHLTRLPNRFRCDVDLDELIRRLGRKGGAAHALFIDLDDFKIVNDCYGHDYGDGVLNSFADFARGLLAGNDRAYRFGGDEFVFIIADGDVQSYLDALLERAKKPWPSLGREFHCSLSIGVVSFRGGDTPGAVIKKADIAMYQAKKSGKNDYVFYSEGLDSDSLRRIGMEKSLRASIANGFRGCVLHYQPFTDVGTGKIVGAEALLRLRANDGSLLLPEHFLELAEYLGLMVPLDEFVMARAAAQCREINAMEGMADFAVVVNMSPKQLKAKNVVRRTEAILRESGVNLTNVIVSINEAAAVGETEKLLRAGAGLRELGVRVALNEFGIGSSSFMNLRSLPVDIVKISSKYVEDIEDRFTGAFVKLVTDLAHFSNKTICMNDVETETQYSLCRKLGVDHVQGFLLHRPDDANALLRMLSPSLTRVFYRDRRDG